MAKINSNYQKLQAGYLFPEIGKRVRAFADENPAAKIIRLGIGDVVLPLPAAHRRRDARPADEMGQGETFKGYGPEQGYDFLREAIADHYTGPGRRGRRRRDLRLRRLQVRHRQHPGHLRRRQRRRRDRPGLSGLRRHQRDGRPHRRRRRQRPLRQPGLPALHRREQLRSRRCPTQKVDLIYLCSPNNPTGAVHVAGVAGTQWVDYAQAERGRHPLRRRLRGLHPRAGPGRTPSTRSRARARCAIEFRSFRRPPASPAPAAPTPSSPRTLTARNDKGELVAAARPLEPPPHHQVQRRQLPDPAGRRRRLHARGQGGRRGEHRLLHGERPHHPRRACAPAGYTVYGGVNAPYIWLQDARPA